MQSSGALTERRPVCWAGMPFNASRPRPGRRLGAPGPATRLGAGARRQAQPLDALLPRHRLVEQHLGGQGGQALAWRQHRSALVPLGSAPPGGSAAGQAGPDRGSAALGETGSSGSSSCPAGAAHVQVSLDGGGQEVGVEDGQPRQQLQLVRRLRARAGGQAGGQAGMAAKAQQCSAQRHRSSGQATCHEPVARLLEAPLHLANKPRTMPLDRPPTNKPARPPWSCSSSSCRCAR